MKTEPKLYFVSGSSGVGKSSLIPHLKQLLPQDAFDVRDLDERGVPDGGGKTWHDGEVRHWIDVANENAINNRSTVVCGFAAPDGVHALTKEDDVPIALIALHASKETIKERVFKRHQTPESIAEIERAAGKPIHEFAEDVSSYAEVLRSLFHKHNQPVVDTDGKTPEDVAREVINIILK